MSGPHEEGRVGLRSTLRRAVDDRGRPVRRLSIKDLKRAARSDHPGLAMLANRLRAAIRSESRRNTPDRVVLMVSLTIGVLVGNAVLMTTLISWYRLRGSGLAVLSLLGLIAVANLMLRCYVRRGAMASLARTAVAEGACGSCAFSLRGAPQEPDGMIVCPECGAAWRAERVVAPYWDRPAFPVLRRRFLAWITPGVRNPGLLFAPDDRGRYVQCPDSRLMRVRPALLDGVPPEERRELRRAMRRVGRWRRVLLLLALSWIPGTLFYGWWELYQAEGIGVWIHLAVTVPIALVVLAIPAGSAFGGPHGTSRVTARRGRCGSCLESLDGAPVDSENRRICRRCGAAWL